jgi:hypothetical protein
MWCPEGYYSWLQVISGLHHTSDEILSMVSLGGEPRTLVNGAPRLVKSPQFYLVDNGFADDYSEADLVLGITANFLMVNFMETYRPVLANLDGDRIIPDWPIFSHKDQFECCVYGWPLKSDPQFSPFFDYHKSAGFNTRALYDRFALIDTDTGKIKPKNGSSHFFKNSIGFEIATVEEIERFADKAREHVICWPDFPETHDYREFLSCIEVNDEFTRALDHAYGPLPEKDVRVKKRSIGRPRQREQLAEAYFEAFPCGHEVGGKT